MIVLAPRAQLKDAEGKVSPSKFTMFVRPKDPEREIWDGFRHGVEGAKSEFGADTAFHIDELARRLPELLAGHDAVVYRWGNKAFDDRMLWRRTPSSRE